MRKLASIQEIKEINDIKNSDFLQSAKILGWNVVIRKGDFEVEDLCVYMEIDSILPEREEFEFLRERKFRIKTVKLRGVISQGIVFPFSILPPKDGGYQIGDDVTEILGVKKYELPQVEHNNENIKGNFPSFIPKSDQTRIESIPDFLEKYKGKEFYITEKLDGTSATYFMMNGVFGVCSRGREISEFKTNLYWRIARKYNIEEKLRDFDYNIAIQGEIVGHKISKNNYGFDNVEGNQNFYLFNVFDINSYEYIDFEDLKLFAKRFNFELVPILDEYFILNHTVDELVKLSHGTTLLIANPKKPNKKPKLREGIVVRSLIEEKDKHGNSLSFKVVSTKFLLKRHDKKSRVLIL